MPVAPSVRQSHSCHCLPQAWGAPSLYPQGEPHRTLFDTLDARGTHKLGHVQAFNGVTSAIFLSHLFLEKPCVPLHQLQGTAFSLF